MAQFIQEKPQVQNVGIGNQQIVQNRAPLEGQMIADIGKTAADAFSTATDIYARDKAKSIVDESLGELERGISLAEKRAKVGESDMLEPHPLDVEESGVGTKEFKLIEDAVRKGAMTRERARLMASSRLKSRIAEQPFAERQLRQAASQIVGFNIESEAARQYFASFPTKGQTGPSQNDYRQGKLEQAASISEALGVDQSEAYRILVRADYAKTQKQAADAQLELGGMNAQEWATEHLTADGSTAFGGILAEVKAAQQEGKPVDSVVVNNAVKMRKESALEELRQGWQKSGGNIGSEDFARTRREVENRYEGYQDLIESVGFDNLDKVKIERAQRTREMLGDKLFPKMKTLSQNMGQQVASDVFNLLSNVSNESQLKLMLERNPALKEAYDFMGRDTSTFADRMSNVTSKVLNGEEVTDQEAPFVDAAVQELHKNGDDETKDSVIEGLAAMGGKYKGLSLIANTAPMHESKGNIETFRRMYRQDLPTLISSVGKRIGSREDVNFTVVQEGENKGDLQLELPEPDNLAAFSAGFAGESTYDPELAKLKEDVDRLNQFSKAHRKGWSQVVEENTEDYTLRLNKSVQEATDQANTARLDKLEDDFASAASNADMESARNTYEKLQERNPGAYSSSFQSLYNEARRRAGLPTAYDREDPNPFNPGSLEE